AIALPAISQTPQVVRDWRAWVALDVDPAGQVVNVVLPSQIPEAIGNQAHEVMSHWRFRPARSHDQAVGAKTYAMVHLQVVRRDEGHFGLQVVYVSNGPRLHPTTVPFPPLTQINSAHGDLLIEAVVRPDGHIGEVQVVESHFTSHDRLIREAASHAVQQWTADPESVGGRPVATRIQLPITLCHGQGSTCDELQPELKLWRHPAAMQTPTPDEAVALDSPLEPISTQSGG
ncbi:MAG TPA: energy transducer TonB, partial [Frateuria sp.]|uniref:energy transducer TonB n=1 Tax=Frateuria sp. TaxID=2211372 RepID=UPI002DF42191|nr:energy transducer TonB [Frateuria sp.]